jgi:hypothetical protein
MSSPPSDWYRAAARMGLSLLGLLLVSPGVASPVAAQQTAISATFASSGSLFEGATVGLAHRSNRTVLSAGVTTGLSHAVPAAAAAHRPGGASRARPTHAWRYSCWDLWDPWYGYPVGCAGFANWTYGYVGYGPWGPAFWWDPYYWAPVHYPVAPVRFTHRFRPRTTWSVSVHVGSGWGWYDPWWGTTWVAGTYWGPVWGPTYIYQPTVWVVRPPTVVPRPADRWAQRPLAPAPRVGYMEDPTASSGAPATRRAVSPQPQQGASPDRATAAPPPDLRTRRTLADGGSGATSDRLPTVIRGAGRAGLTGSDRGNTGSDRVNTGTDRRNSSDPGQREVVTPTTRPDVTMGRPGAAVRTNPGAGAMTGASARQGSSDRTPVVGVPARAGNPAARTSGNDPGARTSDNATTRPLPTTTRSVPATTRPLPTSGTTNRGATTGATGAANQGARGVRPATGGGTAAGQAQVRPGGGAAAASAGQRGTARTGRAGGGG